MPAQGVRAHETGEPHTHGGEASEPSRTEIRREQRKFEAEKKERTERLRASSEDKTAPPAEAAPSEKRSTNMIYRGKKDTSGGNKLWNSY
jgi:hypothetical protein